MEKTIFDGNLLLTIEELTRTLDETINKFNQADIALAEAEKKYQVTMRQKALLEKAEGVSVTFIDKFLRGDEEIAELRKQRDICEAWRDTYQEKINSIKLQIRILNAQADREWTTRSGDY